MTTPDGLPAQTTKPQAAWLVKVGAAVEGIQQRLADEGVVVAVAIPGAPDPPVLDLARVQRAERVDQAEIFQAAVEGVLEWLEEGIARLVVGLEVKGHFHDSDKRYFLINEKAQARSRRRGAHGHLPVVTRMLHSSARVGRVIWINEVEQPPWQHARPFGIRKDPAWPLPLQDLTTKYLGGSLLGQGSRIEMTDKEFFLAYQRARESLPRLRASGFSLDDLSAAQIVHALNQIATSG